MEFHQGKIFFTKRIVGSSGQATVAPISVAPPGSVLLCVRAPVGKVNMTDRELCIGRGLCAIVPLGGMSAEFVFRLLEAYESTFVKQASGTTFVSITGAQIKKQLIPFPPPAEQERIAAKIEKLFVAAEPLRGVLA